LPLFTRSFPKPSTEWPVRLLGDIQWLDVSRTGWNHHDRRIDVRFMLWNLRNDAAISAWLYALVRHVRPIRAVETGVHRGKSTVAILAALRRNGGPGRLISIDLPQTVPWTNADGKIEKATVPEGATGHLVPASWKDRWDLRLGNARDLLPKAVEGGIQFFHHDSEHSDAHMTFEYETAWTALDVGGILATDDVNWSPAWGRFLDKHDDWQQFPDGPGAHRAVRKVMGYGRF